MTAPPSAFRRLRQNELIVSILAVTSIIGWSASLAVKRRHWAQLSPAPLWKTKGGLEPVEPYASYAPVERRVGSPALLLSAILQPTRNCL